MAVGEPTTHLGTELAESEGYLQPRMYRVFYQCDVCGHEWDRVYKSVPKKDPPCPTEACKAIRFAERELREAENFERMVESGVPPGHIGDKPVVKAVDETARIVMEDYGMTNLQDNIREGDMAAPKLPAPLQRQADGYFNGKEVQARAGISSRQAELLKRRALAGAFRGAAVNPNIASFGRAEGEPALRPFRTEKLG